MSVYEQTIIPSKMKQFCEQPHWDASQIYRRTVPGNTDPINLPMPPRPYNKICLEYRTSAEFLPSPRVPSDMIFPGASDKYPVDRYIRSIDNESRLERLDRPLMRDLDPTLCPGVPNYVPPEDGTMYTQRFIVPRPKPSHNDIQNELEVPKVLRQMTGYQCREEELNFDKQTNGKIWFNATKQEKYNNHSGLGEERYDYPNGRQASSDNLPNIQWTT